VLGSNIGFEGRLSDNTRVDHYYVMSTTLDFTLHKREFITLCIKSANYGNSFRHHHIPMEVSDGISTIIGNRNNRQLATPISLVEVG
jgi:hypothetical protein